MNGQPDGEGQKLDRRRMIAYGIILLGFLMSFGGWTFDRAGNSVNIFPMWFFALGTFVMVGGVYLWYISR